jgi:hypothetical protein
MCYYLVCQEFPEKSYQFRYGSNNLYNILQYINSDRNKLNELKILEYHLQGDETYIGVKNGRFEISYKPLEIIKTYLEKEDKYIDIVNEIADIKLLHIPIETEKWEELCDKELLLEEDLESYGRVFEYYGFGTNNVNSYYKFSEIHYFR